MKKILPIKECGHIIMSPNVRDRLTRASRFIDAFVCSGVLCFNPRSFGCSLWDVNECKAVKDMNIKLLKETFIPKFLSWD